MCYSRTEVLNVLIRKTLDLKERLSLSHDFISTDTVQVAECILDGVSSLSLTQ